MQVRQRHTRIFILTSWNGGVVSWHTWVTLRLTGGDV